MNTKKKGAKEFADLVDNDPELRKEVREAAGAILDVARKRGYRFTGKQMQEHLRKKWGIPKPPDYPGRKDDDGPMTTWCWSETPAF